MTQFASNRRGIARWTHGRPGLTGPSRQPYMPPFEALEPISIKIPSSGADARIRRDRGCAGCLDGIPVLAKIAAWDRHAPDSRIELPERSRRTQDGLSVVANQDNSLSSTQAPAAAVRKADSRQGGVKGVRSIRGSR